MQTTVGTIVRTSDSEAAVGVMTALNLHEKRNLGCIKEITAYLQEKCPADTKDKLSQALSGRKTALMINERLVNCPPQLATPLTTGLFDEIAWATEDEVCKQHSLFSSYLSHKPFSCEASLRFLPSVRLLCETLCRLDSATYAKLSTVCNSLRKRGGRSSISTTTLCSRKGSGETLFALQQLLVSEPQKCLHKVCPDAGEAACLTVASRWNNPWNKCMHCQWLLMTVGWWECRDPAVGGGKGAGASGTKDKKSKPKKAAPDAAELVFIRPEDEVFCQVRPS
eukprot:9493403-Pyramimonas_sp.AAC.1